MTDKTIEIAGKKIMADVKHTIKHKKTGAIYKSVEDAESFGIKKEDLQQDVHVRFRSLICSQKQSRLKI